MSIQKSVELRDSSHLCPRLCHDWLHVSVLSKLPGGVAVVHRTLGGALLGLAVRLGACGHERGSSVSVLWPPGVRKVTHSKVNVMGCVRESDLIFNQCLTVSNDLHFSSHHWLPRKYTTFWTWLVRRVIVNQPIWLTGVDKQPVQLFTLVKTYSLCRHYHGSDQTEDR